MRYDCLAFDERKLTMEEYFIKPRPIINPRSWNHNKMMDLALPKNNISINKNLNLKYFEENPLQRNAYPVFLLDKNGRKILPNFPKNPVNKIRNIDPYFSNDINDIKGLDIDIINNNNVNNLNEWNRISYNEEFFERFKTRRFSSFLAFELFKKQFEVKEDFELLQKSLPNYKGTS